MPKVSVIVPNYNHARFLSERLESIFNQTFTDFEVILLDDCSKDNSKNIIEQYRHHPKVSTIIYNEQNSGSTFKQWEKGILAAKGELIWIAESDDYCENSLLEKLVQELSEYAQAGIAYCQTVSVDTTNNLSRNWIEHTEMFIPNVWCKSFYVNGHAAIKNFFLYRNVIPNASAVVFRKSVYEATTGFETQMKLNGDWFFWIKMLEKSDLVFKAEKLNYFRQHDNKATNINTKNFNHLIELCKLYDYLKSNISILKHQKKIMTKTIIRIWVFQITKSDINITLSSFRKVIKAVYKFNHFFCLYFLPVAYDYFKYKIFLKNNLNNRYQIPINLPDVKVLRF